MAQLTQELRSGKMELLEVPFPAMNSNQILVRNHFSVISTGTEGKTVTDARKGYIAKAKSRQKEVKQVLESIKTNGLLPTYKLVMNKLNAPSALGYSCAGEVIEVGDEINDVKVGDFVACGGSGAVHADVVSIPKNLYTKVDPAIDLKYASFATIASIAMQGVRQADIRIGENCAVIGLGLIGQLTVQILNAAGIRTFGIDIDDDQVELSFRSGVNEAINRSNKGLISRVNDFTDGYGVDAVIITAGTSSTDPINLAGELSRRKGKVIVVGAVPTGFDRPNYYKKELDLRMSSSYGPGRYDSAYEEKGIDYPYGYVRWTENRNMKSFIDLLKNGKIKLDHLISHEFDFIHAEKAYDLIVENSEKVTGIVLKYDVDKDVNSKVVLKNENETDELRKIEKPGVGFIGAGSFAQNSILPRIKGLCEFIGVSTGSGNNARYVAEKYNFNYASDNGKILNDDTIDTLFITTRHNLHAENVLKGLKAGKHVFTEKPLAINYSELEEIRQVYNERSKKTLLMVGFNRRFSPYTQKAIDILGKDTKKSILIRVNAGVVPSDHWVHDTEIGGGRVIGEGCHFIDLAQFLSGSEIETVSAVNMKDGNNLQDTLSINLSFRNGGIATINYFSNGNKTLSKEYIEIFSNEEVITIDDYSVMYHYSGKKKKYKFGKQEKGHLQEFESFLDAVKNGNPSPIPFSELYNSSKATLDVVKSLNTKRVIEL